jgi:hypothetical protein
MPRQLIAIRARHRRVTDQGSIRSRVTDQRAAKVIVKAATVRPIFAISAEKRELLADRFRAEHGAEQHIEADREITRFLPQFFMVSSA